MHELFDTSKRLSIPYVYIDGLWPAYEEGKNIKPFAPTATTNHDECDDVIENNFSYDKHHPLKLTLKQQNNITCRFITSARKLLTLQIAFYGKDHPNVPRTYFDLATNINRTLSRCPQRVMELKLKDMMTFAECSRFEQYCRMEFKRIDNLYPRDLDVSVLSTATK